MMYILKYETAFAVRRHLIRLWNKLKKEGVRNSKIRNEMLILTGFNKNNESKYTRVKATPYPKLKYIVYLMFEHYIKKGTFILEYPKGNYLRISHKDFDTFNQMLTYNPTKDESKRKSIDKS